MKQYNNTSASTKQKDTYNIFLERAVETSNQFDAAILIYTEPVIQKTRQEYRFNEIKKIQCPNERYIFISIIQNPEEYSLIRMIDDIKNKIIEFRNEEKNDLKHIVNDIFNSGNKMEDTQKTIKKNLDELLKSTESIFGHFTYLKEIANKNGFVFNQNTLTDKISAFCTDNNIDISKLTLKMLKQNGIIVEKKEQLDEIKNKIKLNDK